MPAPYAVLGKTCLQRNKINLHKTFPASQMPGTFLILSALRVLSVDTACCANMRVPASVSCVPATTVEQYAANEPYRIKAKLNRHISPVLSKGSAPHYHDYGYKTTVFPAFPSESSSIGYHSCAPFSMDHLLRALARFQDAKLHLSHKTDNLFSYVFLSFPAKADFLLIFLCTVMFFMHVPDKEDT